MTRMTVEPNSVKIRMYRHGHGDCFLLAFPRPGNPANPVYVLIDCGYKPGSHNFLPHHSSIGAVVKHIADATARRVDSKTVSRLDLVVITHEHQDHVNGFWKKVNPYFEPFSIEHAWLAWTEHPTDPDAVHLRQKHRDQLLNLIHVREHLKISLSPGDPALQRINSLLAMEIGGDRVNLPQDLSSLLAAADPSTSMNKQGMKLVKDKAAKSKGVQYLGPEASPQVVPGTAGVIAYVLGPPRDERLLRDEDPEDGEEFQVAPPGSPLGLSLDEAVQALSGDGERLRAPFSSRFIMDPNGESDGHFFANHYGNKGKGRNSEQDKEVRDNASFRRIDGEWLRSGEDLALKLNTGINNTSLVLAFELPQTKKVLLFIGDAQRGNWISWVHQDWARAGQTVTAKDLLARTVLYKVGHHGSHNATLKGTVSDDYPNLDWIGRGAFASELTAMIPAVHEWAMTKNTPPWRHPLPAIKEALLSKCGGRVIQTDEDKPRRPREVSHQQWSEFINRVNYSDPLCIDLVVRDE